ncbi:esterase-like activity of phytase family protein [Cupriavidus gilardii]|uniref:esterase-like activity of phytase family protein n=1 Tax=Cupriavidus gilardii TaxID=82541 RepID=UPI001EE511CC|nr:esterase-like activity of phytase family protein [Cupriavidus gilardii]MCG5261158.1 esterase-like activity of phytase family protein [Cupriavidus gilardii]
MRRPAVRPADPSIEPVAEPGAEHPGIAPARGAGVRGLGLAALVMSAALLAACGGDDDNGDSPRRSVGAVRLIGEQTLPNDLQVGGTTVGGLSGVDYDPAARLWYLVSDDRSDKQPARFYTARLSYDLNRLEPVQIASVVTLRQADGSAYPNRAAGGVVPDPEAIRFDPSTSSLWWTSEGDRALGLDPFVARARTDGTLTGALPLPPALKMSPTQESGSRNNATFEGLSLSADGKSLWVSMEGPLYQDGALPTPSSGSVSRLLRYDRNGNVLAQYVYPLDPIPAAPAPGRSADNGVTEILAIDDNRLLTLERAGVQGADGNFTTYVRLYQIDIRGATDVRSLDRLTGASYVPVQKRLVQNLNTLGLKTVDNIEGMAWGPKLPNGRDSLVLVSDNNFNASQITQVLAFEVLPE